MFKLYLSHIIIIILNYIEFNIIVVFVSLNKNSSTQLCLGRMFGLILYFHISITIITYIIIANLANSFCRQSASAVKEHIPNKMLHLEF